MQPHVSSNTRRRDLPLANIMPVLNQLQKGTPVRTEEAHALRYKALLAEARATTDGADEY